ncbi:MAG: putative signal transducing protein [Limisphaerales bacterium]
MDFVTIYKTLNSADADLVRAQLEAAGFQAEIATEFATLELAAPTTAGGIRIQVPEDQAADAKALLDATINTPSEASP